MNLDHDQHTDTAAADNAGWDEATRIAETYYDSDPADRFYRHIWGGEDIHIGIYETDHDSVFDASRRTVAWMADRLGGVTSETKILDIGAGYGGAARYLVKRFGCRVDCLNLSEVQNRTNRALNTAQGVADRITVLHGSFETIPATDESYHVVWSEDAILHSADRARVLREVRRVLKPGGTFIMTDPMQADGVDTALLQPVLDRLQLPSLGSIGFYRETATALGFSVVAVEELTEHLRRHYARVGALLRTRYDEMIKLATKEYCDRMLTGLDNWVAAADHGRLAWGILQFRK